MKETEVKKRGWVKNAAIIFLAVMLVLTFFSNTIMNRSLPEVAAQYTTSGSITARIRDSGTVTANSRFEVILNQTRTVEEIPVSKGDEVKKGDVLIRLGGSESVELEGARTALRTAERLLEEGLINSDLGDNTVADAVRNVQSARNALSDAQSVLAGIQYNEAAYNAALAANNQAQAAANAAEANANATQYNMEIAQEELDALDRTIALGGSVDPAVYAQAEQKLADAENANGLAQPAARLARQTANATERDLQSQNRDAWIAANGTVRNAQLNLNAANDALALAQSSESASSSLDTIEIRELRRDVEEAREKVEELEKESSGSEITSPINGVVVQVDADPGQPAEKDTPLMFIDDTDRGYSLTFAVTAEQASRVSIGDQAEVDRGWWSQRDDIRATLVGIRNNPQSPATSRILQFSISGEIESGMPLNLILNQRTESYNIIVPNSAIRTDTNGDFVLVVMSRSSPLGNRYIATRVDVNIIASDDTHSAVAGGGLTGWDFVITTATAPIDPGMQVRLVDNP